MGKGGARWGGRRLRGKTRQPDILAHCPTLGTTEAEIKFPSAENQEISIVLFCFLKPRVGENIAWHASSLAQEFCRSKLCSSGPFNFISLPLPHISSHIK